jgi:hypothetical protein
MALDKLWDKFKEKQLLIWNMSLTRLTTWLSITLEKNGKII